MHHSYSLLLSSIKWQDHLLQHSSHKLFANWFEVLHLQACKMGSDMNGYEESLSVFETYKIISIFLVKMYIFVFLGTSHLLIKMF